MTGFPPPPVRRVAMLSMHTSPLDQPGTGDGGGLNVYVVQAATRLASRGIEVDIFTRRTAPDQPDAMALTDGVEVHHVAAGPARRVAKDELPNLLCPFTLALQRHPLAGSHDVVHANYWLSGWVGRRVAARWDRPLVQTFHTIGALKNATLAPGDRPEPPLRLLAEQRIAAAADRVLALGCEEAGWLHELLGVSGRRISVVPAGVDTSLFGPGVAVGSGNGGEVEGLWPGGAAAGPRLLFVGRLQPLKGPDVALRTFAEVRTHDRDARLLIVGGASGTGVGATGPAELAELAAELGVTDAVAFLPALPQRDLADVYRAADVVLVPSRSETFGLVALEAQAVGTPVVASAVGGLRTVVDGGGLLVDGHEPASHAAAVRRVLGSADLAATLAAEGVRTGLAHSWDATADRLVRAYAEVAHARLARRQVGEAPLARAS